MAGREDRKNRIIGQLRPLPNAFIEWMDNRMPCYIVYEPGKKNGVCTGCGKESAFDKLKYSMEVTCPKCGKRAEAKTKKRMNGKRRSKKFVYLQKINHGILARFVEREYIFYDTGETEKSCHESLMAAVEKGRRQYWYEKRGGYRGDEWAENHITWSVKARNSPVVRIAGFGGWSYRYERLAGPEIYKRNLQGILKDSLLKYFPMQGKELTERINKRNRYNADISGFLDVYEKIHRYPQLEQLYKAGMKELVEDYICETKIRLKREKEPHKILGVNRELFRELRKQKEVTQEFVQLCIDLQDVAKTASLAVKMAQIGRRDCTLFFLDLHMPIEKTLRYVKVHSTWKYRDYIEMAREAGSDMSSEFVLFPRDLDEAHDSMLEVKNEKQRRKERKKAKEKDADIEKVYKKIKKKFSYEDDNYLIRPAKSNEEIVIEGQKQHICVGRVGYADRMIKGKSYILFLRKKEEQDKPFYTVEITPEYEIRQRHGKYNKEGEEVTEVDDFLNKFRKERGHVKIDNAIGV